MQHQCRDVDIWPQPNAPSSLVTLTKPTSGRVKLSILSMRTALPQRELQNDFDNRLWPRQGTLFWQSEAKMLSGVIEPV